MDLSVLATEIATDPMSLGYAGQNAVAVAKLLNTPANLLTPPKSGTGWTKPQPLVPIADVLTWASAPDTTVSPPSPAPIVAVEAGAANTADPLQGECEGAIVLLNWSNSTLDLSSATVLELIAALQAGGKFTANQQASLLALGVVPCSRAEALFGAGTVLDWNLVARAM